MRIPAITCAAVLATSALGQLGRLSAMGDSLSDEYAEETYAYAKNWPMQLMQLRGVDMGRTAAEAGQQGGTWGEPRRRFNESNWARSGATSATLLSQGQHTGVASQAGAGVTHTVLAIGANDFSPSGSAYFNIYYGLWSQGQINTYVAGRIVNVRTALDTVIAAGVDPLVCTFVDYGVAPAVWQSAVYSDPVRRQRVTNVIARVNDAIHDMARERSIPLMDMFSLGFAIFGPHDNHRRYLLVGNVAIDLWASDTQQHTNPAAGFVHDGVHPNTSLQGVFANVIVTALNLGFGAGIDVLTESEICTIADLAYGGSETLESQLGPPGAFVVNYRCLADFDEDGFVSGDDFDGYVSAFIDGALSADYDGNGFVNGDDFDGYVAAFEVGCG